MAAPLDTLTRPLSAPVRFGVLPVLFVFLLLLFVYLRFPYDRAADSLARGLSEATAMRVEIGELVPAPSLWGPGWEARRVRIEADRRKPLHVERMALRPAWSLSWLRGVPALFVDLESAIGSVAGAIRMGGGVQGFDGHLGGLDLSTPWIARALPIEGLAGTLEADADLIVEEGMADGDLRFAITDGSFAVPGTPLGIPFESIEGDLRFGGDRAVGVDRLALRGPMLDADASGGIGQGPAPLAQLGAAAVDLQVGVQVKGNMARNAVRNSGVKLGRDGRADFSVSGTLSNPRVR